MHQLHTTLLASILCLATTVVSIRQSLNLHECSQHVQAVYQRLINCNSDVLAAGRAIPSDAPIDVTIDQVLTRICGTDGGR